MPIICWGNLAKSADDTTRIEQAIMGYIEGHDANPNAHMGEDYSLGAHRLSVEIDHLPYSIRNKLLYPQSRTYKAIVDPAGYGDETDIQKAIDFVNSLGGGSIFVKAGTYVLNSDITLYNNIEIIGEDNDTVIFDFNSGAYQFKLIGTSGTHKKNCWLRNIQVKNSRKGMNGAVYFNYVDDSGVINCKFQNNKASSGGWGSAINASYCTRISIEDNYCYDDEISIWINECTKSKVSRNHVNGADQIGIYLSGGLNNFVFENLIENSGGSAIWVESSHRTQIIGNFIKTFASYGITTGENNPTDYLVILGNYIENTTSSGSAITMYFGSKYCSIVGNVIKLAGGDGIYLSDADRNTIVGNVVTGGDVGLELTADCNRNVVIGNQLYGNTTNLINNGTNGDVAHNLIS